MKNQLIKTIIELIIQLTNAIKEYAKYEAIFNETVKDEHGEVFHKKKPDFATGGVVTKDEKIETVWKSPNSHQTTVVNKESFLDKRVIDYWLYMLDIELSINKEKDSLRIVFINDYFKSSNDKARYFINNLSAKTKKQVERELTWVITSTVSSIKDCYAKKIVRILMKENSENFVKKQYKSQKTIISQPKNDSLSKEQLKSVQEKLKKNQEEEKFNLIYTVPYFPSNSESTKLIKAILEKVFTKKLIIDRLTNFSTYDVRIEEKYIIINCQRMFEYFLSDDKKEVVLQPFIADKSYYLYPLKNKNIEFFKMNSDNMELRSAELFVDVKRNDEDLHEKLMKIANNFKISSQKVEIATETKEKDTDFFTKNRISIDYATDFICKISELSTSPKEFVFRSEFIKQKIKIYLLKIIPHTHIPKHKPSEIIISENNISLNGKSICGLDINKTSENNIKITITPYQLFFRQNVFPTSFTVNPLP